MKPDEVEATRREISAALKRKPEWRLRLRLIALDMVLSGKRIEEAAASANVQEETVNAWLGVVVRDGIVRALAKWENRARPPKLDADAAALRDLAAKEQNPRIRKRMLALACMADGMGVYDATASTGLDRMAITRRIKRFEKEGVAAFQDRKINGKPAKLSGAQLQTLRANILERPDMSYRQLRDLIRVQFGVHYSLGGLKQLVKRELGIVWVAGVFQAREKS